MCFVINHFHDRVVTKSLQLSNNKACVYAAEQSRAIRITIVINVVVNVQYNSRTAGISCNIMKENSINIKRIRKFSLLNSRAVP